MPALIHFSLRSSAHPQGFGERVKIRDREQVTARTNGFWGQIAISLRSEAKHPKGGPQARGICALTPKTPAPDFLSLSMSVLHARALARGGVAGRTQALARTVRHGVAPRLRLAMTGRWGLLPALAWRASTRRGVLRASGNAAAHEWVAALAIDGAKWGLKCSRASTLQIRLATGHSSPP